MSLDDSGKHCTRKLKSDTGTKNGAWAVSIYKVCLRGRSILKIVPIRITLGFIITFHRNLNLGILNLH